MRVARTGGEPVFDRLESAAVAGDASLPKLNDVQPLPVSLTVSPDGTRVAFGAFAGGTQELWALSLPR